MMWSKWQTRPCIGQSVVVGTALASKLTKLTFYRT